MTRRLRLVRAQRTADRQRHAGLRGADCHSAVLAATATMNAYLGGDTTTVVPAALGSLACLGLNAGLLWYLFRLDHERPANRDGLAPSRRGR